MSKANPFNLAGNVTVLGIARCSEASPQCTAVAKQPNGDLVLANQVGAQFVIPAGEALEVLTLALRGLAP
jgi:hypothetical protein